MHLQDLIFPAYAQMLEAPLGQVKAASRIKPGAEMLKNKDLKRRTDSD